MSPPRTKPRDTELDAAWQRWLGSPNPSVDRARSLITQNPDWTDPAGCGPLVWVLRNHRAKPSASRLVRMLVELGLNPNEPASRVSPLFEAVFQGDGRSLRYLLTQSIDFNDPSRASPLFEACGNPQKHRFVLDLLRAGCPIEPMHGSRGLVDDIMGSMGVEKAFSHHPGKLWEGVADILIESPMRWSEFRAQLADLAEREELDNIGIEKWLSGQEARVLGQSSVVVRRSHIRRI